MEVNTEWTSCWRASLLLKGACCKGEHRTHQSLAFPEVRLIIVVVCLQDRLHELGWIRSPNQILRSLVHGVSFAFSRLPLTER